MIKEILELSRSTQLSLQQIASWSSVKERTTDDKIKEILGLSTGTSIWDNLLEAEKLKLLELYKSHSIESRWPKTQAETLSQKPEDEARGRRRG